MNGKVKISNRVTPRAICQGITYLYQHIPMSSFREDKAMIPFPYRAKLVIFIVADNRIDIHDINMSQFKIQETY